MDFGLARPIADGDHSMGDELSLTAKGVALGTPGYMPPEQVDGNEVDERSDVYSTGVVLYWLCSGHQPYPRAKTFAQVVRAMATESPRAVDTLSPEVPNELARLIMQCLHQNREDRPASATELFERFTKLDAELKASGKNTTKIRRWRSTPEQRHHFFFGILEALAASSSCIYFRPELKKASRSLSSDMVIVDCKPLGMMDWLDGDCDSISSRATSNSSPSEF